MYTIPIKFQSIVERLSYKGKNGTIPLSNITFFLGAGFSKAWDNNYPLGADLFKFDELAFHKRCEPLGEFIRQCGFDPNAHISMDIFSECYYKLEMLKKYPDIRPRYIDEQTIKIIDNEFKFVVWEALNKKVKINYSNDDNLFFGKINNNQSEIIMFFARLYEQLDGSQLVPEGLRANFITTNYDFVLEGILDEYYRYFEDYQLLHNYRGFTPLKINGKNNLKPLHDHWLVNNLFKINGGIEIYQNSKSFNIDYREPNHKDVLFNPPEIILPSKEQNYTSKYFKSIFSKITRLLQESKILIIIGYSFPKEDALLRFILRHFAEDDRDMISKLILYIDIGEESSLLKKVSSICPSEMFLQNRVLVFNKGFVRFAKLVNCS